MRTHAVSRLPAVLAALAALLIIGAQYATAAPPAPLPINPSEGATVTTPTFSWQAAAGAAHYEVEVGPLSDPNAVSWTARTANRALTPVDGAKFSNGLFYWRVRALDSGGVAGPWSKRARFTLSIPAPSLVLAFAPEDQQTSLAPTLQWRPNEGQQPASYKVEVSASPNFVPVVATYTTYNERVTPVNTLPYGTLYWRVSGVDADGHAGAPGASWKSTRGSAGPILVKPAADAAISTPEMEWKAVTGAAYYKVELSASPTFVPVLATFTTYNLAITPLWYPVPPPPPAVGVYHWRVSGVDAGGHVGSGSAGRFTLTGYPAADGTEVPQLSAPADGATVTTSPTFRWTRVPYTNLYRLTVSKYADFHAMVDRVETIYDSYTPYGAGRQEAYADGVYYWKVEARDYHGSWRATSAARSFTKKQPLPLSAPAGGAVLTADPTFRWSPVVGAQRYRLIVSKYADFHATYDAITSEYSTYTPYTAGSQDAYTNSVYYWKVEARDAGDGIIATSAARSFTRKQPLTLSAPADGASGSSDPTFLWERVVGAQRYRLIFSKYADFHAVFDTVTCDYSSYTPYTAGTVDTYPPGTYYWKVEARSSHDVVITASKVRKFTIASP